MSSDGNIADCIDASEIVDLGIVRARHRLAVDLASALDWYRNKPLPCFDEKTPQELVIEGRAADVMRYLQSIDSGFSG
ncbi:antitoxin Xre/MbcA/ParS toxin-binding domain-containing protein [Herbaspirillum robiniae]|uniref:antitoxin Xre/MbcA/ParS toxin-binding domain-containing protein n=1 Tax=Herbaspirillum robiniae TaxID=2014887 RepID=UPI0009A15531|nr:antitoxin Xre/MbcA/ParS toxin-binding domain-containing protein [Herbaspirillum robiniae]